MTDTRLQLNLPDGRALLREGLLFRFFMKRTHDELSLPIQKVLNLYLDEIGPERLRWHTDFAGDVDPDKYKAWSPPPQPLDDAGWARVHDEIRAPDWCLIELQAHEHQVSNFQFDYHGQTPEVLRQSGSVSHVSSWLPLDWLKTNGPSQIHELTRAIARELPLDSGYVSPAFHTVVDTQEAMRFIAEQCLDYPGLDIPQFDVSLALGTRVRGAYWLNVYGPAVLERLGGRERLRARLAHPGLSVEDLGADKLLVSLGDLPEVSTAHAPSGFRAYRHLARVLEPVLHEPVIREYGPTRERWRAWWRRFLDDTRD